MVKKRKLFDLRYVAHERRKSLVLGCLLFWSLISFLVIRFFFLGTVIVQGKSMTPTLWDGEQYFIHRWIYMLQEPQRGEIVVVKDPDQKTLDVKRVVGLPNETVEVRDGDVYLDGAKLEEPYLAAGTVTDPHNMAGNRYAIDPKHYFVLGDNRRGSEDSRDFGAVNRRAILGKINKRVRS